MDSNIKYRQWEHKRFRFLEGTFYRDRFGDNPAQIVKIGTILVHYQVDGDKNLYSMPLQNLDPKQQIVTLVDD